MRIDLTLFSSRLLRIGLVAGIALLCPLHVLPAQEAASETGPNLDLGGALRLNYSWQDYNPERRDRFGDFGLEVFMATVEADYGDLFLSAQYRWYADFETIKWGYVGFRALPGLEAHVGISQVPFGILPWASHSFWFGATYYMGFEDDYDTGVKVLYENDLWDLQAAFYKNDEYVDASRAERYSFDLVTGGDQANREVNQLNIRAAREWTISEASSIDVGASFMLGGIYNETTKETGLRRAGAFHADGRFGPWNVQLEVMGYRFEPKNPPGVDPSFVQLAGFRFPFLMAAEGSELTLNLARDFNPGHRFLEAATCYTDFSTVAPRVSRLDSSTQIVTGCLLTKGGLYTYMDWITGRNMWFAGGPGIGLESVDPDPWKGRLNINMGFYF